MTKEKETDLNWIRRVARDSKRVSERYWVVLLLFFYQGLIYLKIENAFLHRVFPKHPLRVPKYHKRLQKTPKDIPKAAEGEPEHPNQPL